MLRSDSLSLQEHLGQVHFLLLFSQAQGIFRRQVTSAHSLA
nr:MAG TPA: hypothetical protein [Caudoviricetes sp.]